MKQVLTISSYLFNKRIKKYIYIARERIIILQC